MPAGRTDSNRRAPARDIVEALGHPLRSEIFEGLTSWLGTATVAELAEFAGAGIEEVAQHVAVLERSDLVEPISARGDAPAAETAYRATREPLVDEEEWAAFPPAVRRRLVTRSLEKLEERLWAAIPRGGFDGADVHVSWVPTELDERAYAEMSALLRETLERAFAVHAESVQRRADGTLEGDEVRTELVMMHFRREGTHATPPSTAASAAARERLYALTDDIASEIPGDAPDWARIAGRARELAAVAERYGRAVKPQK